MKIKRFLEVVLTAAILLSCIPLSVNAAESDMKDLFSVYMKYHDFLKQTAEKYDANTWRFTFDYIDSDGFPELLIALSENKKETKVQFYSCKPDGKVTFQYLKGKYATVTYIAGKNKVYDGYQYDQDIEYKYFNANSQLDGGYSYSEENFYTALTTTKKAIVQPYMNLKEVELFQWYEYSQKNKLPEKFGLIEDFLQQHKASYPHTEYALQLLNNGNDLYLILRYKLYSLSYYYCDLKNNQITHIGDIYGTNLMCEQYGKEMLYSSCITAGNHGNRSVIMKEYQIKNQKIEEKLEMTAHNSTVPVTWYDDETGRPLSMAEMDYIDYEYCYIDGVMVSISDFYCRLVDCFSNAKRSLRPIVFYSIEENTIENVISESIATEYTEDYYSIDGFITPQLFVKYSTLIENNYKMAERYHTANIYNNFIQCFRSNDIEEYYYIITTIDNDETPEIIILKKDRQTEKSTWAAAYTIKDAMFCDWSVYPYLMTEDEIYEFVDGKEITPIKCNQ